jgi:hypothetical protein
MVLAPGRRHVHAVDADPQRFVLENLGVGLVQPGMLADVPHRLAVIHLDHARPGERFGHPAGRVVPRVRVLAVPASVVVDVLDDRFTKVLGDRVLDFDVPVLAEESLV